MIAKRAPDAYAPAKSKVGCQLEMSKPWTPFWRASLGAAATRPREARRGRVESFIVSRDIVLIEMVQTLKAISPDGEIVPYLC